MCVYICTHPTMKTQGLCVHTHTHSHEAAVHYGEPASHGLHRPNIAIQIGGWAVRAFLGATCVEVPCLMDQSMVPFSLVRGKVVSAGGSELRF